MDNGLNGDLDKLVIPESSEDPSIKYVEDLKGEIGDKDRQFVDLSSKIKEIPAELRKEVMEGLIDDGYARTVAQNLQEIPGLDKEFAFKLIDADQGARPVAFYLEYFKGLNFEDQQEIAERLLDKDKAKSLADTLDQFQGLDEGVADNLKKSGLEKVVEDNPDSFTK